MINIISTFDRFILRITNIASTLLLAMVFITFLIVILRYMFGLGYVWLQELLVWMHGTALMLGISYTMQLNGHVRVDIFYKDFNDKSKAKVEIFSILFFLIPLSLYLIFVSWNYVWMSWSISEISRDSGGIPFPAIPIAKTTIMIMPFLLLLQSFSLFVKQIKKLKS